MTNVLEHSPPLTQLSEEEQLLLAFYPFRCMICFAIVCSCMFEVPS